MARLAQEYVARGFSVLKLKVGKDPEKDIERVKAVREAVGRDVRITVDANCGWSFREALYVLRHLHRLDVELCEQPLIIGRPEELRTLRRLTGIPIMLDEDIQTLRDLIRFAEADALDVLNIKLCRVGGVLYALALAKLAEEYDIPVLVGCTGESEIGIAASLHFCATVPNLYTHVDLDSDLLLSEHTAKPLPIKPPGTRSIPSEPGLGVSVVMGRRGFEPRITGAQGRHPRPS
mgnify:CR=1 FL=1